MLALFVLAFRLQFRGWRELQLAASALADVELRSGTGSSPAEADAAN
jgi:hypothetical protein